METAPVPLSQPIGRWSFPARRRVAFERLSLPTYVQLGVAGAFIATVVVATNFRYDGSTLNGAFLMLALLCGCGIGARWASFARLGGATESMALLSAISIVAPICATLLAATALPLADPLLAGLDRHLFAFDRHTAIPSAAEWHPYFLEGTRLVYHSLTIQPYILLAALFLCRQEHRAWAFVSAWMTALLISVAIFPFFPAYGTPPYSLDFQGTFDGARSGVLRTIGIDSLTGIITFPSFHAAGAVLLGWGFWSLRGAAPLFVPLNVLMFLSALFAGGHYLVDLFAGAAVAIAAIVTAEKVQHCIRRRSAGEIVGFPSSRGS